VVENSQHIPSQGIDRDISQDEEQFLLELWLMITRANMESV
jgi:hypothetical protein